MQPNTISDAHKKIVSNRIEKAKNDPSRLTPIEDFFKEFESNR